MDKTKTIEGKEKWPKKIKRSNCEGGQNHKNQEGKKRDPEWNIMNWNQLTAICKATSTTVKLIVANGKRVGEASENGKGNHGKRR